jgi:hypothetical protein
VDLILPVRAHKEERDSSSCHCKESVLVVKEWVVQEEIKIWSFVSRSTWKMLSSGKWPHVDPVRSKVSRNMSPPSSGWKESANQAELLQIWTTMGWNTDEPVLCSKHTCLPMRLEVNFLLIVVVVMIRKETGIYCTFLYEMRSLKMRLRAQHLGGRWKWQRLCHIHKDYCLCEVHSYLLMS